MSMPSLKPVALALAGALALPSAGAAEVVQKVKPPVSQAYIDLATFNGGAAPAQGVGGLFGSMFGGGAKSTERGNSFGQTQGQSQGRWMDVTLLTRNNANLKAATQGVPAGSKLAPTLNLLAPEATRQAAEAQADSEGPGRFAMPKGKMYLYWGCGTEVRKGQPLVIDFSRMDATQYAKFFQNRSATMHPPLPAPGHPGWPNKTDDRMLPQGASMAGEHVFAGDGVVDGFKFNVDAAHDLMPAVEASRSDDARGVLYKWKPMQEASGWFVQAMGMRDPAGADNGDMEMVYWTSSELPDMGMGLVDYQPDGAIAKWQKEKIILAASATECAAPKEAVSAMAMSRVIAYGDELNMAYPPRPKDPKIAWEPQWDVKVRRKSVASLMPGMGALAMNASGEKAPAAAPGQPQAQPGTDGSNDAAAAIKKGAFDLLRGVLQNKAEQMLSK